MVKRYGVELHADAHCESCRVLCTRRMQNSHRGNPETGGGEIQPHPHRPARVTSIRFDRYNA